MQLKENCLSFKHSKSFEGKANLEKCMEILFQSQNNCLWGHTAIEKSLFFLNFSILFKQSLSHGLSNNFEQTRIT